VARLIERGNNVKQFEEMTYEERLSEIDRVGEVQHANNRFHLACAMSSLVIGLIFSLSLVKLATGVCLIPLLAFGLLGVVIMWTPTSRRFWWSEDTLFPSERK
jgi:hypothetical protein